MQHTTKNRLIFLPCFAVLLIGLSLPLCGLVSQQTVRAKITEQGDAAATFQGELCKGEDCANALLFRGAITEQSVKRLAQAIEASKKVKKLEWVCLESFGGEADAAAKLAGALHNSKIGTCVVPREVQPGNLPMPVMCGSACSALWLGGSQRILSEGGVVGFHAAYSGDHWCCVFSNQMKLAQARSASQKAGAEQGDAYARSVLFAKGSNCKPNEFYRLKAPEALQLGLVSEKNAQAGWRWRSTDLSAVSPPQPMGGDCRTQLS